MTKSYTFQLSLTLKFLVDYHTTIKINHINKLMFTILSTNYPAIFLLKPSTSCHHRLIPISSGVDSSKHGLHCVATMTIKNKNNVDFIPPEYSTIC